MSIILICDTETTGLIDFKLDINHPSQPNAVEVAAVLYNDETDNIETQFCSLVIPDGFTIDNNSISTKTHGITQERAENFGMEGYDVCSIMTYMLNVHDEFLAYNKDYDIWILTKLFEKYDHPVWDLDESVCVMQMAKEYFKIPPTDRMKESGFNGYKSPKLSEAYKIITGKELIGAHSAMNDVMSTLEIYKFLKKETQK